MREHHGAYEEAVALAEAGRHADALERLSRHCRQPSEHLLPWRIETLPAGATIQTSQGQTRRSPTTLRTAAGEHIELRVEAPGYVERTVSFDDPGNRRIALNRAPERVWKSLHRVDAAPVASGPDHIVANRAGRIARLSQGRPGSLEQGAPFPGRSRAHADLPAGAPGTPARRHRGRRGVDRRRAGRQHERPLEGRLAPRRGARPDSRRNLGPVRRRPRGRLGVVDHASGLRGRERLPGAERHGPRRRNEHRARRPPRSERDERNEPGEQDDRLGRVQVESDHFLVHRGDPGDAFPVERVGEWNFLAWEPPNALISHGRLWVSDEEGLRSYRPDPELLQPWAE